MLTPEFGLSGGAEPARSVQYSPFAPTPFHHWLIRLADIVSGAIVATCCKIRCISGRPPWMNINSPISRTRLRSAACAGRASNSTSVSVALQRLHELSKGEKWHLSELRPKERYAVTASRISNAIIDRPYRLWGNLVCIRMCPLSLSNGYFCAPRKIIRICGTGMVGRSFRYG